jgi:hypothetical protein
VKRLLLFAELAACCSLTAQTSRRAFPETSPDTSPVECAAASNEILANAHVAFTVAIPNAGPMAYDGTYLWVTGSDMVTAVNPATGAIVTSQSILGTDFIAYDTVTGTLWLEGGSHSAQLNKVNAQQIIATNGNAAVDSIAFASGSPTGLALDISASGRNVWAVAGGVASIIPMGTLDVANTVATPDGYPITQINDADGLGGMMLATAGMVNSQAVANLWLYAHNGTEAWQSSFSQTTLSAGAWNGYSHSQLSGEAEGGTLYQYVFSSTGGTGGALQYILLLTDYADGALSPIGGFTGLAVSVPDGLTILARQETSIPNQIYFVSGHCGAPGDYVVPGLSVPGAVFTAFGGGLAWASTPGPSGGVTAMTY